VWDASGLFDHGQWIAHVPDPDGKGRRIIISELWGKQGKRLKSGELFATTDAVPGRTGDQRRPVSCRGHCCGNDRNLPSKIFSNHEGTKAQEENHEFLGQFLWLSTFVARTSPCPLCAPWFIPSCPLSRPLRPPISVEGRLSGGCSAIMPSRSEMI